jgi:hypothetical protein
MSRSPLARLIGDADMERTAWAKLHAAADVEVAEIGGTFSAAAGYIATTGIELPGSHPAAS